MARARETMNGAVAAQAAADAHRVRQTAELQTPDLSEQLRGVSGAAARGVRLPSKLAKRVPAHSGGAYSVAFNK